ncbi:MAG: preprotein translocase subunit SecE [Spirochaetes bacterium RBG_16_49_21]|nr:MAG: preprotein translocase subunit SecE [Spirochaetes bacterium RBG_16_49_21]
MTAFRTSVVFVRDAREELKKVTWPSRDEVTSFTIVVVITVIILSVFLWLVDSGLVFLIKYVTK